MELTAELSEQIHSHLTKAQALAQEGQAAEAKAQCQEALKLYPGHPDTNQILGLMFLQEGAHKKARTHLDRSLKAVPDQPYVWVALGQARRALKDIKGAGEAFLKAIELAPEFGAAYGFLEELSTKKEMPALSGKIFDVFLGVDDLHPQTRIQLSYVLTKCLEKAGEAEKGADVDQFHKTLQALVKGAAPPPVIPGDAIKAELIRARDHLNNFNLKRVEKITTKILDDDPGQVDALQILALSRKHMNNYDAAVTLFRKALGGAPNQPQLWIELGNAYKNIRRFADAEHAYRMANLYDPKGAEALYWLGSQALGRGDDRLAETYLRRATRLNPGFSQPYELLRRVKGFEVDDGFIAALEKNAEEVQTSRTEAAFANYTLAAHHFRQKNREAFIKHADRANQLQRDGAPVVVDMFAPLIEESRKVFTKIKPGSAAAASNKLITPIFIVGVYRSGSTLVEQILASHSAVAAGDELHFIYSHLITGVERETGLPYPAGVEGIDAKTWGKLGQSYQKRLAELAPGTPFITDKLLENLLYVGLIRQAMPWAKVIHVNRNAMDRALSIYSNYFNEQVAYCYDLKALARHTKLTKTALDFWKTQHPGFVLDVQYEDLVGNTEAEVRRILEFCGLPWQPECLEFYKSKRTVMTLSIEQVHQPIFASSVGKWKDYADVLKPFREEMGDWIDADGFLKS